METWDIYDSCFVKTGRTHERGKPLASGDYHLIAHVYPVNDKGQILIQKRADTLSWKPGKWAATSGSATVGEDGWTTCQRELEEELGIKATRDNSSLAFMLRRREHFTTVWIVNTNIEIEELVIQPAEVAEAKWVNHKELKKMVKKGEFLNYAYLDSLLKIIDEGKGN